MIFLACLFICSLYNIFVYCHAYAYKTYEHICILAKKQRIWQRFGSIVLQKF